MSQLLKILCLLVVAGLVSATSLQAADVWWDYDLDPDDAYEEAENWEGDAFPGTSASAKIQNGTVNMSVDATNVYRLYLGVERTVDEVLTPGHVIAHKTGGQTNASDDITLASGADCTAVLYMSGGEFGSPASNDQVRIGSSTGTGYAYVELSGTDPDGAGFHCDDLMVANKADALGVLYQTGGTVSVSGSIRIGDTSDKTATYNLTGGIVTGEDSAGDWIKVGGTGSAWGHLNVGGTGTVKGMTCMYVGQDSTTDNSRAYLTLGTGGVIEVGQIQSQSKDAGEEAFFSFHGGTLRANRDEPDFIMQLTPTTGGIFVGAEGGTIDTNGFDIEISQPLQHPTDYGVSSIAVTGGVGAGYLGPPVVQLSGGSGWGASAVAVVDTDLESDDYGDLMGITVTNPGSGYQSGDTVTVTLVRGGTATPATATATLALNAAIDGGLTVTGDGSGSLTLSAACTYNGDTVVSNTTLAGTGSIAGDLVCASSGSIAPGASVGTFTVGGAATITGTLQIEYEYDDVLLDEVFDVLDVGGNLNITGATVDFDDIEVGGTTLDNGVYVFAEYGTLTGTFATVTDLPSGYSIDYDYNGDSVALIPEPAMLVLLMSLLGGVLLIRRRR